MMTEFRATLIGTTAVLMWGALALFTSWSNVFPPFQLVFLTFSIAFLLVLMKWLICRQSPLALLKYPAPVWILGIGGLFGYHAFYFMALANAPAIEASLIAYLWPLLIVVFSAMLPGERLRWYHVTGALLGLAGCILLVSNGGDVAFKGEYIIGYIAAVACALTWTGYSIASRRFLHVPTDIVGWFCGATAILGLLFHLIMETTIWPDDPHVWFAVFGLGLGPVGLAFFTWDIGIKHGNIKALGAFSYAAPLLSAVLLVIFGDTAPSWVLLFACLAIVGGAILAARDLIFSRP
jgi:drug/metabolite transporter (DMT)-like permease